MRITTFLKKLLKHLFLSRRSVLLCTFPRTTIDLQRHVKNVVFKTDNPFTSTIAKTRLIDPFSVEKQTFLPIIADCQRSNPSVTGSLDTYSIRLRAKATWFVAARYDDLYSTWTFRSAADAWPSGQVSSSMLNQGFALNVIARATGPSPPQMSSPYLQTAYKDAAQISRI